MKLKFSIHLHKKLYFNEVFVGYVIVLLNILCFGIALFIMLHKSSLVEILFAFTFIILIGVYLLKVLRVGKLNKIESLSACILVLSFFSVVFSALQFGKVISFGYLKEYLIFICTVLFLTLVGCFEIKQSVRNLVLKINICISAMYPVAYLFFPNFSRFRELTLNFPNPNLTGVWIMIGCLYLTLAFFSYKSWRRLCLLVLLIVDLYLLYLTAARNAWLAFLLFIIIILFKKKKNSFKYSNIFILLVILSPLIFVFVYLVCIKSVVERGWFDFLIQTGKSLTSRVNIWMIELGQLKNYWLFGNYVQIGGNAHNSFMTVFCSFGIFNFILLTKLMYIVLCKRNQAIDTKKSFIAFTAFFAVLFVGFGEGVLFSGGIGIYICACSLLLI